MRKIHHAIAPDTFQMGAALADLFRCLRKDAQIEFKPGARATGRKGSSIVVSEQALLSAQIVAPLSGSISC
jgi:hypothetical protein